MGKNKEAGNLGEREVVELIQCPNCKKELMLLPESLPLVDIQCKACHFRAQVKTNNCKPKDEIFGSGWDIMEKTLKAGYFIPPLITNFKWRNFQEIRLYPFIPWSSLKKRILSPHAKRANYKMFNYVGLTTLPFFVLYKNF